MSKQANRTLIGAFVVGAVLLLIAAIVVFGSGQIFSKTQEVVMYFDGSVKGLNIGAPLVFRGVSIGSVTDIILRYDPERVAVEIPVIGELDLDRFQRTDGGEKAKSEEAIRAQTKKLVDRGLRAQLQIQSFVTGQLMIAFDFYPDEPARFRGKDTEYPEIPTIPSPLQAISETIERLPIEQLVVNLTSALQGIDAAMNSPELTGTLREMYAAVKEIQVLVGRFNSRFDVMANNVEGTLTETRTLVDNMDNRVSELTASAKVTAEAASAALVQLEKTLKGMDLTYGERSALQYEARSTLIELRSAARSLRDLAEYLEQHPESLLRGSTE